MSDEDSIGCMSHRPTPVGTDIPEWAFSIRPEELCRTGTHSTLALGIKFIL